MPRHGGIANNILLIGLLLMVVHTCVYAQTLSNSYQPSYRDTTIIAFLGDIEKQTDISLSYSTSQFDAYSSASLLESTYTIAEALNILLSDYEIDLIERSNNKVIISVLESMANTQSFTLKGIVRDKTSGEKLYGAAIYQMGSGRGTHCNESGFYSLSDIQLGDVIRVSYIGYSDAFITVDTSTLAVTLSPNAQVSTVIITEILSDYINQDTGGDVIDLSSPNAKTNILGEKDVMHIARQKPGVFSGSEGVGGILVRGGSQDQNLMLFEDVPMYAVNHLADISSVFMEDAVRDAQLIRGGFPSRFSGRLSSVLQVQMKDGNQDKIGGSVSAGLPGFKAFLEGPITEKASFMIGGRTSWINAYIDPFIDKFTVFENLDIDFHDFVAKYTYRFSNTSTFSLSGYSGGDDVRLDKNQFIPADNGKSFRSVESTRFGWDNDLLSMKFTSVLSDKVFMSANAGILNYSYRSSATYDFTSIFENQIELNDKRAVVTKSGIIDLIGGLEFDYFLNAHHKVKFGLGVIQHRFSPKIEQSLTEIDIEIPTVDSDSITVGNEFTLFLEDTYSPSRNTQIYFGLNYTRFGVREAAYNYLQPRFKITLKPQKGISLNLSASRMVQFVHLLANNGLGLPSDLWVPSTDEIAPETSDQFSFTVDTKLGNDHLFTIGGFIKKQRNILMYRDVEELYKSILNDASIEKPNFVEDRDWERRIENGERNIAGLEVSLKKSIGIWQYSVSYTRSKGDNRFANLNQGNAFTDRFDRPHDFNISTSYQLGDKWNVGMQWVYGSGNTFTLRLIEIPTLNGFKALTQDELNNYRMPAFHHLDIMANYDNTKNGKGFKMAFGIYNVYNRYNPYYLYVFRNNVSSKRVFKKLSLFPLLPQFNLTYSF